MMLVDRPAQQAMPHDSLSAKKMTLRKIARKNLLGITQDLIAAGRDVASRRASLRLPLGLRFPPACASAFRSLALASSRPQGETDVAARGPAGPPAPPHPKVIWPGRADHRRDWACNQSPLRSNEKPSVSL